MLVYSLYCCNKETKETDDQVLLYSHKCFTFVSFTKINNCRDEFLFSFHYKADMKMSPVMIINTSFRLHLHFIHRGFTNNDAALAKATRYTQGVKRSQQGALAFRAEGKSCRWMIRMLISDVWIRTNHAAVGMDAFELFRKLGTGAKFDLKRFGQDAARFKVMCKNVSDHALD